MFREKFKTLSTYCILIHPFIKNIQLEDIYCISDYEYINDNGTCICIRKPCDMKRLFLGCWIQLYMKANKQVTHQRLPRTEFYFSNPFKWIFFSWWTQFIINFLYVSVVAYINYISWWDWIFNVDLLHVTKIEDDIMVSRYDEIGKS